jgi:hypothetical protein
MQRKMSFDKSEWQCICLLLSMLAFSINSFGQNQGEFSGKWIFDKGKSSSIYSSMVSVMFLTQVENVIKIEITQKQGDTEQTSLSENYTIGSTKESENGTLTTSWSEDKQSFSILEVKGDRRILKEYSLNDGGKILTIKSDETLQSGFVSHTVMTYKKAL